MSGHKDAPDFAKQSGVIDENSILDPTTALKNLKPNNPPICHYAQNCQN